MFSDDVQKIAHFLFAQWSYWLNLIAQRSHQLPRLGGDIYLFIFLMVHEFFMMLSKTSPFIIPHRASLFCIDFDSWFCSGHQTQINTCGVIWNKCSQRLLSVMTFSISLMVFNIMAHFLFFPPLILIKLNYPVEVK